MNISKRDRIREIADEVRILVKPTEIIPVSRKVGRSWTGQCPYHGGKNKGNFMVSDEKRIFKCFNCGAKGDVIKFFADDKNINYAKSALKLAERYNIISYEEYKRLTNKNLSKKDIVALENHFIGQDKDKDIPVNEKADDKILDEIYRLFIESIEFSGKEILSKEHLEYLKTRCDEEQIKKVGYFTFPTRYIRKTFFKLLDEAGYNISILKKVPGFYYDSEKGEYTFAGSKSIGIPIKNEFGQLVAIQRRFDQVKEGESRYRWFSSSFSEYGCSPGAPMEFILPKEIKNKTLFITEGHFKGYKIANTFGSPVLSIPGVQSWRKAVDKVTILLKNINNLISNCKIEYIYIAFDSDMSSNLGVLSTSVALGNSLYQSVINGNKDVVKDMDRYDALPTIKQNVKTTMFVNKNDEAKKSINNTVKKDDKFITFLLWDVELGKGIDDFLDNGHSPKTDILKVNLNDMINYTYNYVKALVEKDKSKLEEFYEQSELIEKDINAKSILNISNKYWKVFRDISDEDKELLFNDMILSQLSK